MAVGAIALVLSVSTRLRADQPSDDSGAPDVIEEFNVAGDGDALTVLLDMAGRRCRFCVDTGAPFVMVDKQLEPLLGNAIGSIRVQAINAQATVRTFEAPVLRLGKSIDLRPRLAMSHDLTMMRQVSGHEIYGIIGMSALYSHTVRFDPDRGKLTFLKAAGADPGVRVVLNYDRPGCPQVTATVTDSGPELFTLDTGLITQDTGTFETRLFRRLERRGVLRTLRSSLIVDAAGRSAAKWGRTHGLSLGGFTCTNVACAERTGASSNLLGLGFLSRFIVTFDFPRNVLYLKAGAQFDRPDLCDLSGLHFLRRRREVIIDMVDAESPAAQAGIRTNDVLLTVNGADMLTVRLFPIRRLLSTPGETVQLAVKRNGRRIERSLVLPACSLGEDVARKGGWRTTSQPSSRALTPMTRPGGS